MASRGWDGVTATDIARMQRKDAPAVKPSKYKNIKSVVLGHTFDSKREAATFLRLHAMEQSGEIHDLKLQVDYQLMCPIVGQHDQSAVVAIYRADFTYRDKSGLHVVDAKGHRTSMYQLKKKWLELQSGIVIEEV